MKHGYCTTREERRSHFNELSKLWEKWVSMNDIELLNECKLTFPNINEATREECLKYLMLTHVEKMI